MNHRMACDDLGPYTLEPKDKYKTGSRRKPTLVRCNRPSGHDGNHISASVKSGPTHEWTCDGKRVSPA